MKEREFNFAMEIILDACTDNIVQFRLVEALRRLVVGGSEENIAILRSFCGELLPGVRLDPAHPVGSPLVS